MLLQATQEQTLEVPAMMLTRFGRELLRLSSDYPRAPSEYIERLVGHLKGSEGLVVPKFP